MTLLSVQESLVILREHYITINDKLGNEQMIKHWLQTGEIQGIYSQNSEDGWRICETELDRFMNSLRWEGTSYEDGIDDKIKIKRLNEDIKDLKLEIEGLRKEKEELEQKLGILPF